MADEALRVPIEIKDCRFLRSGRAEEFARFLLETEQGSFRPDPEFGCRSPYFSPEYATDLKTEVRNHVLEQFRRYMGIAVNVTISDKVEQNIVATFTCRVYGTSKDGQRFDLSWEI
jgi:hypothetical protein